MPVTPLRSPEAAARWLREWTRGQLRTDSRKVQAGDAFVAWPGHTSDGRRFVPAALQAGAATCLVEQEGLDDFGFNDARVASLPRMKAVVGEIADAYFDQPSKALDVVAVTGTNGKTSSAWWVAQALTLLGRRCGVVGTLGVGTPPIKGQPSSIEFTGLTTPDQVLLHANLRRFVDEGYKACAMEASSIGIDEHRLAGVRVKVAMFTNFTQDHLDYHGTMDAYWAAKRKLFAWPGLHGAVINVDDAAGAKLASELDAKQVDLVTYTTRADVQARLVASNIGYEAGGLAFDLHEQEPTANKRSSARVRTALIGDYNVSNVMGVIGALRVLGVSLADAASSAADWTPVPGRMQRVQADLHGGNGAHSNRFEHPEAVVDYAHTPDALDKALSALKPLAKARGGKLVAVFGCGGDRDPSKRPKMGAIAAALADVVVVTSDNPRHEDPAKILSDIESGLPAGSRSMTIQDRRGAIERVLADAHPRDVILIAGKGHEDYQDIRGVKHPFSDVDVVEAWLSRQATTNASGNGGRA